MENTGDLSVLEVSIRQRELFVRAAVVESKESAVFVNDGYFHPVHFHSDHAALRNIFRERYCMETGAAKALPGVRPVQTYEVRVEDGEIQVSLG